jgi:hypothetical protein
LQEDKNRNSEAHNIKMRIWEAREELDTFVKKLRQEGYNI